MEKQRNVKKYKKLEVKRWIKISKVAYRRHKIYNCMHKDQRVLVREDQFWKIKKYKIKARWYKNKIDIFCIIHKIDCENIKVNEFYPKLKTIYQASQSFKIHFSYFFNLYFAYFSRRVIWIEIGIVLIGCLICSGLI